MSYATCAHDGKCTNNAGQFIRTLYPHKDSSGRVYLRNDYTPFCSQHVPADTYLDPYGSRIQGKRINLTIGDLAYYATATNGLVKVVIVELPSLDGMPCATRARVKVTGSFRSSVPKGDVFDAPASVLLARDAVRLHDAWYSTVADTYIVSPAYKTAKDAGK